MSGLIERAARGLRAARDYTPRQRRDHDFIFSELVPDGLCALAELRSLLIEADAYISHMLYRGSWPDDRYEVEQLIGRLRSESADAERTLPAAPDNTTQRLRARIIWNALRARLARPRCYPCATCGYRYDCEDGCHS